MRPEEGETSSAASKGRLPYVGRVLQLQPLQRLLSLLKTYLQISNNRIFSTLEPDKIALNLIDDNAFVWMKNWKILRSSY